MIEELSQVVSGVLESPQENPDGSRYDGRFKLYDVQLAGGAADVLLTSTLTVRQLLDAAETRMIWTDQQVQRGIKPGLSPEPDRLLALADGFPDKSKYIFDASRAKDIAEKLLQGERLFLNPLVWNLRPGSFEVFHDSNERRMYLYDGRFFLPDSHHRHQGILHAARIAREAPTDYPAFSLDRSFSVEIYFMSIEEEGEYFFEKNNLGKSSDRSKGYDLTTQDGHARVARQTIEFSDHLSGNVNRVTDRLAAGNAQVMTLSTLVGMVKTVFGDVVFSDPEIDRLARSMAQFYDLLVEARPELGRLEPVQRQAVRSRLLVDQAVMMHGYAQLARRFVDECLGEDGTDRTPEVLASWRAALRRLRPGDGADLFERSNEVWRSEGVLQTTKSGGLTVSNTRQSRDACARILARIIFPESAE